MTTRRSQRVQLAIGVGVLALLVLVPSLNWPFAWALGVERGIVAAINDLDTGSLGEAIGRFMVRNPLITLPALAALGGALYARSRRQPAR